MFLNESALPDNRTFAYFSNLEILNESDNPITTKNYAIEIINGSQEQVKIC